MLLRLAITMSLGIAACLALAAGVSVPAATRSNSLCSTSGISAGTGPLSDSPDRLNAWLKSADATPASRIRPSIAVPASRQELVDLFEHLERELDAGGFFFPPAKKGAMVRNIRAMILRSGLTDQQARTIRGMIVALVKNKYRGEKKA